MNKYHISLRKNLFQFFLLFLLSTPSKGRRFRGEGRDYALGVARPNAAGRRLAVMEEWYKREWEGDQSYYEEESETSESESECSFERRRQAEREETEREKEKREEEGRKKEGRVEKREAKEASACNG